MSTNEPKEGADAFGGLDALLGLAGQVVGFRRTLADGGVAGPAADDAAVELVRMIADQARVQEVGRVVALLPGSAGVRLAAQLAESMARNMERGRDAG